MLDIRPLSPELAQKAREELNEVPERLEEDVAALRAWLTKCPHIKSRTDDQFLVMFLRGAKHSLERAKQKLDLYYTIRTALPELIRNRDPLNEKLAALMRMGSAIPLPYTDTPSSPRIFLIRPGAYDPAKYSIQDVFKFNSMMGDIMMKEDDNLGIAGQMGILDLSNTTMAHFLQFNPTFVKKATMWSQEGSPLRLKGFHYINTPSGFETVYNLFKSFMTEKNRSRLMVHGSNMESLYQHIPKRLLPTEYGGEAGPLQDIIDKWVEKIESYRDFFLEDEQYGTDEKKTPGPTQECRVPRAISCLVHETYHQNLFNPLSSVGAFANIIPCSIELRLFKQARKISIIMVNVRPLSSSLTTKARDELNEKPERINEDLNVLRQWIAKSPHLRSRIDDQFLIAFLRGCKYSLERAKEKLDMFYTVRTMSPELIRTRDPENPRTRAIIRLGVGVPLPYTETPDSPRIILVRPAAYDPAQFSIEEVIRVSTMANDIMMIEDDNFVIGGQIGILDLANVSMAHFLQFSPTFVKKMTMMSQEASPFRQKGFHYVNTPNGFEMVFNMFRSFMSEKNKSRLYVHGHDLESLYRHVPKRLLPAEYGGDAGSLKDIIANWEKKIVSYRDYFLEEDQYGTDEKKRPGRPKNAESLFGVEGSFRQLQVD
nr:uncharacterized protein LOC109420412 [Aedes albopictus]